MTPRFAISSIVWRAAWESTPATVVCPDCGGEGRIRCLLHDDSMVSVECRGCSHGYEPPSGRLNVWDRKPLAKKGVVVGMEISSDKLEYRVTDGETVWIVPDEHIFSTEDEASACAVTMAETADREERERIATKEKDTRSWAWNVHYHRREIREAWRRIEYHTAKLAVARVKEKEPA